jgi:transposase
MTTRRRGRLPRSTQFRLIEHFVTDTPARTAAEFVGVNRNTATLYYLKLRETIVARIAHESPFEGEFELDGSYRR